MGENNLGVAAVSVETPLGYVVVFGDDRCVLSVRLGVLPVHSKDVPPFLLNVKEMLEAYFTGEKVDFNKIPVRLAGTDFQKRVWVALRKIPYGNVQTYKWLADSIGCPSPRAVGRALSANKIPIIVPCHRIVKKDGTLGGFSSGLKWKRYLLELEGVNSISI